MTTRLLALAAPLVLATASHAAVIIAFDHMTSDGAIPSNYASRVTLNSGVYRDAGSRDFTANVTASAPTPGIAATWASNIRVDGTAGTYGGGALGTLNKVAYKNDADGAATTGFQGVTFQADPTWSVQLVSLNVATDATFATNGTFSLRIQTSANGTDWTTVYQNFSFGATANATYLLNASTTLDAESRSVAITSPVGGYLRVETNKRWNLVMDNITIAQTQAVPEPATFAALAGFAALGLASARRRRRA